VIKGPTNVYERVLIDIYSPFFGFVSLSRAEMLQHFTRFTMDTDIFPGSKTKKKK
jgi:hypothetical protein